MLGLDAAGKTTILYKLHIGEVLSTVPTIGRFRLPKYLDLASARFSGLFYNLTQSVFLPHLTCTALDTLTGLLRI